MNTGSDINTNVKDNTDQVKQTSLYVLTKDTILMRVVEESPRAAELLAEYGLHCIGCYFSDLDTLETGSRIHGMGEQEIDDMITEINEQLEKEWKEGKK